MSEAGYEQCREMVKAASASPKELEAPLLQGEKITLVDAQDKPLYTSIQTASRDAGKLHESLVRALEPASRLLGIAATAKVLDLFKQMGRTYPFATPGIIDKNTTARFIEGLIAKRFAPGRSSVGRQQNYQVEIISPHELCVEGDAAAFFAQDIDDFRLLAVLSADMRQAKAKPPKTFYCPFILSTRLRYAPQLVAGIPRPLSYVETWRATLEGITFYRQHLNTVARYDQDE